MAALLSRINWLWRLFATGLAFTVFGVGGLLLPLYALPVLLLTPAGDARERRARWLVHVNFKAFMHMMQGLGIMRFKARHLDDLRRPGQLILANHPSLIDVVFLISLLPQADCVVKANLLKNPTMRGVIGLAGYIANNDPEQVLEAARASMRRGNSLIIFPEGTRTVPGKPIRMQRGAANVALRLGRPIRPVLITVEPDTLTKHRPWYQIPAEGPFVMTLTAMPELPVSTVYERMPPALAARKLTRSLEDYFTEELRTHGIAGT